MTIELEDKVEWSGTIRKFELSGQYHTGPYSNSKKIPIINLHLKVREGEHVIKIPIDVPDNPFSVRLIEQQIEGEQATYTSGMKRVDINSGPVWYLKINSGTFKNISYKLEELADW